MGTFLPEFHDIGIEESDGLLMTVLIQPSLRHRSIYFELHQVRSSYKLYWCYETPYDEILAFCRENGYLDKLKDFDEFLNNEDILTAIKKQTVRDSGYLEEPDEEFFMRFIHDGLPKLDRKPPWGLDGHSYYITIKGNPDRSYHAWCVIPKEWSRIQELIERLGNYTDFSGYNYKVSGIK